MEPVLALEGISKHFGGRPALEDVTLHVEAGEVHCLLGENGAGKSTLCNIVFGVHRPDTGQLRLGGQRFQPAGPAHALASGIATRVRALCEEYGLEVDLNRPVEDLSVGERQRIEVLRCLLDGPQLLVLDEPTAVLPPREVKALLEICRRLAARGCGLVLVTHKLAEIAEIATRTTVLRRGRVVETVTMSAGADLGALVSAMVGREVRPLNVESAPRLESADTSEALRLEGLVVRDAGGVTRLDLSLTVRRGEIVGLAGVEGNGQSQLGAVLAGLRAPAEGRVLIGGTDVTGMPPRELSRLGVGIIPEDRHAVGCHLQLTVAENLLLGSLDRYRRFGLLRRDRMARDAEARMKAHDVRAAGPDAPMASLSGGNQQKVVLARELALDPLVFLLAAQPTRGLDVGAVEAVYTAIRGACARGAGVLLVSSELDQLLAVADRVLVIYRGRIVGELPAHPDHKDAVGSLMSGQQAAAA